MSDRLWKQYKNGTLALTFGGIIVHESQLADEPFAQKIQLLSQNSTTQILLLCDSVKITPSDIKISYNISVADCLYGKSSVGMVFDCLQRLTRNQRPRTFPTIELLTGAWWRVQCKRERV
jgi:hypothetical protein